MHMSYILEFLSLGAQNISNSQKFFSFFKRNAYITGQIVIIFSPKHLAHVEIDTRLVLWADTRHAATTIMLQSIMPAHCTPHIRNSLICYNNTKSYSM